MTSQHFATNEVKEDWGDWGDWGENGNNNNNNTKTQIQPVQPVQVSCITQELSIMLILIRVSVLADTTTKFHSTASVNTNLLSVWISATAATTTTCSPTPTYSARCSPPVQPAATDGVADHATDAVQQSELFQQSQLRR